MIYLIAMLTGLSVVLFVVAAMQLVPVRPRALTRRLAELERGGPGIGSGAPRGGRLLGKEWVKGVVQQLGGNVRATPTETSAARALLNHAGYRHSEAVTFFRGARLALFIALGGGALFLLPLLGAAAGVVLFVSSWLAAVGWLGPVLHLRQRIRSRQGEIQRMLPDSVDLLVVCVEAGLGLNQALVRVSQEIRHVSPVLGEELSLVNLEIRAGVARHEALRNLGERTGVQELRTLAAMLIQTDRFGTSVGQALRTHAETLRTQRRQRAEEAAAKTTVKLIFPMVLFIFPAMFVVVLGPAIIQMIRVFSGMQ